MLLFVHRNKRETSNMITITVTPETSAQMSIISKALIALLSETADAPAEVEPKKTRKAKDEALAPTPAAPETATATPEVSAPAEAATASPSKPITLEEVRAKLAALSQAGKTADVKALISKFGAGKLTDLAADKYSEVLLAAEAL
jgi:hypothetical protein